MIKRFTYLMLLILMFFSINMICNAQSVNELEKQVNKLQSDIKTSQSLLKKTSKNKETTLKEVELLQAQIKKRDDLIKTYEQQLAILNKETRGYKNDVARLQNELDKNRQEYADLLVIHYRNRNNLNNLLFIFSSEDFNQAIRRMRYIQQFNDLLKHKMKEIDVTKTDIKKRIEKNEADKKRIEKLNAVQKKERDDLNKDRKVLNDKVAKLKKQEKSIKKEIEQKQKETKDLQARIKKIISEEVAKNRANATVDTKLSANFEGNKGKLPWPVASGVVTKKYGNNPHPTQSKVVVFNNGIDISTEQGANALCVFDGQVSTVFNTGSTNVVMVRHGLYFTLYANLDKVFVKSGDKVKTGEKLGLIHTGANDNITTLHFEVWNDKNNTNPEMWLK
ncbi:MAG: peptidoglycan DD-metalloendopeptidase family protein [Bacteroidales bacterium]|nr:peptidoglycan DD-metalloendopeptidase family protein [Bacteroidales bacterium]MBQ3845876.1 peptidoglycan DD-metalloendopeptidase family protein [Bacteroidales bacterium]